MGYWNVENLFDLIDDPDTNDDEFSKGGRKNVTDEIYQLKLSRIAEGLTDLDADVVGLSEVENELVLQDLVKLIPSRKYEYIHYDNLYIEWLKELSIKYNFAWEKKLLLSKLRL